MPNSSPQRVGAGPNPSRPASPALFLALAFALGIILKGSVHPPPDALVRLIPALLVAASVSVLAGAALLGTERYHFAALVTLTGFVLAGSAATVLFGFRFPPNHVSQFQALGFDPNRSVKVGGVLLSDSAPSPAGPEFNLEANTAEQTSPDGQLVRRRLSGRIQVRVQISRGASSPDTEAFDLHAGDRLQAAMRLRQLHVYSNPGGFDFRERAADIDDLYWEGSIDDGATLRRLSVGPGGLSQRAIESMRTRLRRVIDRLYPPWSAEGRDGAVLKAILLGDRASLDSATIDHFRVSGLYHLLVIAGLHVGLIAALVLGLLRLLRLGRTWRNLLLLAVLLAYALIVEQRAPTLRATIVLVVFLVAQFLDRGHSALNAVGLAALALLLTRPAWLFESGFQLSFAAALLIVGLAAPVLRMTLEPYRNAFRHLEDIERDSALPPRQAQFRLDLRLLISALRRFSGLLNRHPNVTRRLVVWPLEAALWITGMVLFSAVLQIGLMLPMVEQFHRVTLAGIGLNALALPLMGVLLAVAIPTVLLGVALPSLAIWPAKALAIIFRMLFAIAEWPHLPAWLSYRVPSPPYWAALGFAVSLAAVALALGRNRRILTASSLAFLTFALMLTTAPFAPRLKKGALEITALDCGGGQAVVLRLPDGPTVLIGSGGTGRARSPEFAPTKRWDPGENIVSPYLWSRGIKALDVVVVTSAAGNLEGFVSVLQNFRVGEIWFQDAGATGLGAILDEAARRGVTAREISASEELRLGTTTFQVLAPLAEAADPMSAGTVPMSLRVSSGEASALVASGTSDHAQRQIMEPNTDVRCVIMATGRQTLVQVASTAPETGLPLLAAARLGLGDRGEADLRLPLQGSADTHSLSTDTHGAITVEMKGNSLRIRSLGDDVSP